MGVAAAALARAVGVSGTAIGWGASVATSGGGASIAASGAAEAPGAEGEEITVTRRRAWVKKPLASIPARTVEPIRRRMTRARRVGITPPNVGTSMLPAEGVCGASGVPLRRSRKGSGAVWQKSDE